MQFSSSEDLKALADIPCCQMVMTKLSSFLFSVCAEAGGKKLRSTVQRSTETGLAVEMRNWMTRQASRESTDGSMNSYSSEGKWVRLAGIGVSSEPAETIFSVSVSLLSQKLAHTRQHRFHFCGLICCEENFCSPATEQCDISDFFISRDIGLGIKCFTLTARC